MAKNISPLMAHENEVHGLVAWSVIPTRILYYLSLLIAAQHTIIGLISSVLRKNKLMGSWQIALAVAFLFMAWQVNLFSKQSKSYVASEMSVPLDKALSYLGGFWLTYQLTLFFSVTPLVAYLIRSVSGLDYQSLKFKNFIGLPVVFIMAVFLVRLFRNAPPAMSERTLSQSAESFANKNLSRARTLTFISIGIGILWIWAYLGDALLNTSLDTISVALSGSAYLLIGSAVGFVWRSVREIQRNPSPIYFERTMEKVNFFWLATCIGFVIILIGNLL